MNQSLWHLFLYSTWKRNIDKKETMLVNWVFGTEDGVACDLPKSYRFLTAVQGTSPITNCIIYKYITL